MWTAYRAFTKNERPINSWYIYLGGLFVNGVDKTDSNRPPSLRSVQVYTHIESTTFHCRYQGLQMFHTRGTRQLEIYIYIYTYLVSIAIWLLSYGGGSQDSKKLSTEECMRSEQQTYI